MYMMHVWTLDIAGPIDQQRSTADKNNDVAVKYDQYGIHNVN